MSTTTLLQRLAAAAALLALLGCGDDGESPNVLTAAQVNGTWTLQLTLASGGSGCLASPSYRAILEFSPSGDVGNTVSHWTNDPADPDRYNLTGNVQYRTGQAALSMWHQILVTGWQINGTFRSDGTMTGTVTDPIPGNQRYFPAGCTYTVSGQRTAAS